MPYRYNKSLPTGFVEGESGQIVKDQTEYDRLKGLTEGEPITRRYNMNAVSTGTLPTATTTETKTDPIADFYTNLGSTYKAPDEVRRQQVRAQAEAEVETQIAAINAAAARLMNEEKARQKEAYNLSERQVSALGRMSGLAGSQVQRARQQEAFRKSQESERAALAVIEAQRARDEAALRGSSLSAAQEQLRREEDRAFQVKLAESQWLQSLKPSAQQTAVEVGGYLVDPTTGKVIFAAPEKDKEAGKLIEVGGVLFDPNTNEVVLDTRTPENPAGRKTEQIDLGDRIAIVDSTTGELVKEFSKSEKSQKSDLRTSVVDVGGKKMLVNMDTGETIREYTEEDVKAGAQVTEELSMKIADIGNLLKHPGKGTAVGTTGLQRLRVPFMVGPRNEFVAKVQQLTSQATLDELAALKAKGATLGALSDTELKMLQSSATAINSFPKVVDGDGNIVGWKVPEVTFDAELTRMQSLAQKAYNRAIGIEPPPTSSPVVPGTKDELDNALDSAGFKKVGSDTGNARRVASAIGQFESGGNYKALGPVLNSGSYKGDRAYGKYQVMGKNIPSWTKEALGRSMTPQEFLADPKAQDAVAEYRMGRLLAKGYEVEDIASIWFSGQPLAKAGNRKDQLGTSVPSYAKNVRAIYNRAS